VSDRFGTPTLHQRAAELALHAYLTTLADGMAVALLAD
jgi:hypothetical protein